MKKVFLFSILFSFSFSIFAQVNNKSRFTVNISVGQSLANLRNSKAPHVGYFDLEDFIVEYDALEGITNNHGFEGSITKDILSGFSAEAHLEYSIKNGWSIQSGLNFEQKGFYLNRSKSTVKYLNWPQHTQINYQEQDKIKNNYLTFSVSLRKRFFKKQCFFGELGVFAGQLISSSYSRKYNHSEFTYQGSSATSSLDYKYKDAGKKYTNKFDFGFSTGLGFAKNISDRLKLTTELSINIGMLKVDSKYNNEFSAKPIAASNGIKYFVHSTNYYGFNSNAKNINLVFSMGFGYLLGK